MTKIFKSFMIALALLFVSTNLNADVKKGQKIIIKKLKKDCGFNGAVMASKHTQAQWKKIYDDGALDAEIKTLCPSSKPLKEKYIPHVYDFLYNFALDSGNVPSC